MAHQIHILSMIIFLHGRFLKNFDDSNKCVIFNFLVFNILYVLNRYEIFNALDIEESASMPRMGDIRTVRHSTNSFVSKPIVTEYFLSLAKGEMDKKNSRKTVCANGSVQFSI